MVCVFVGATYEKQFAKLLFDFAQDVEYLFGKDFNGVPEIKQDLDELDRTSTKFAQEISDIGKGIQAKLQQSSMLGQQKDPQDTNPIDTHDKTQVQQSQSQKFKAQQRKLGSDQWKTAQQEGKK